MDQLNLKLNAIGYGRPHFESLNVDPKDDRNAPQSGCFVRYIDGCLNNL